MKDRHLVLAVIAVFAVLAMVSAGWVSALPAAAASPQDEPVLQATPEPTEELGAGDDAPDLSMSGLKTLQSYRSEMYVDWKGIKDKKPVEGYISIKFALVRQPPASELNMESSGLEEEDAGQSMAIRYVQVGDQMWFYDSSTDSWMQMPAGDMDTEEGYLGFSPSEMLPGFNRDRLERESATETVNGVECYKYSFTEKDLDEEEEDLGEIASAQGEAWVAVEGDYIVKFTLNADIASVPDDTMFESGTVTMRYDVTDINQPIVIEPPADAGDNSGQRDDIPMLPDAEIDFSMMGMVSYSTASTVEEAADFYKQEMPKNGWEASQDGVTEMEDFVLLNYVKGGDKANIMISKDDSKEVTSVMISIESESGPLGKDLEMDDPVGDDDPGSDGTAGGSAAQPPADVPLMPDAEVDSTSTEGYILYTTSSSLQEIETFYEEQMPANGWEPEKDNDLLGNGYLDYSKDGGNRVVNIYAAEEDGQVTVDIFIIELE